MQGPQSRGGRAAVRLALVLAALAGETWPQAHQPPKVQKDDYVWEHESNPFGADPDAIVQGRRLYRSTCYICHLDAGGRGPDLRKSRLKEQDFMRVVINGRKGTQMPAWKGKLSEEEMWKIYAFLQAPRE